MVRIQNGFRFFSSSVYLVLRYSYVQVSEKKARDWCASRGNIPYFETSAKEDINVDAAFLCVAKTALANEREHDM